MKRKGCWPDREQVAKHSHRARVAEASPASGSAEVELPLEVVWLVLQCLGVEDLLRAQLVCVAWRDLIHSEQSAPLWKSAYFVSWPLPRRGPPPEPNGGGDELGDPPKWRSIARRRLAHHLENDPNRQLARLAWRLTDQLQQVPDEETPIKWLKGLLERASDHAELLEGVIHVKRQLHSQLAVRSGDKWMYNGRKVESTEAAVRDIASLLPNIYWSHLRSRELYYDKNCKADGQHYKRFVCHRVKAVIYSVTSGLPLQLTLTFDERKRSLKMMPYARYKAKDYSSPRPGVSLFTSPERYRSLLAHMATYLLGDTSVLSAQLDELVRLVLLADKVPKLYSLGYASKLHLKSPWPLDDDVARNPA